MTKISSLLQEKSSKTNSHFFKGRKKIEPNIFLLRTSVAEDFKAAPFVFVRSVIYPFFYSDPIFKSEQKIHPPTHNFFCNSLKRESDTRPNWFLPKAGFLRVRVDEFLFLHWTWLGPMYAKNLRLLLTKRGLVLWTFSAVKSLIRDWVDYSRTI